MAIQNQNATPGSGIMTLDSIVYVNCKITEYYFDYGIGNTDPSKGEWTLLGEKTELKRYDLNNPLEYGAFVLDESVGFEEERLASNSGIQGALTEDARKIINLLAITRVTQNVGEDGRTQLSSQDKTLIIDAGKPYTYPNTKRLAVVAPQDGKSIITDIKRIQLYEYNYDDKCEKLDFDGKVYPGTNKQNPSSPCYGPSNTGSAATQPSIEIGLLTGSFTEFSNYKKDFKSVFQEIGFKSGSLNSFQPFQPKRFELVSSSRFVDEFEDILTGPVRLEEITANGDRGTVIVTLVGYQKKGRINKRTGAIVTGSTEEVIFTRELSRTGESLYVFKPLSPSEVNNSPILNKTRGAWNGDGSLYSFYTSSIQTDLEKSYKFDVISGSGDNNLMFTIYYGDFAGGGTAQISDDRKKTGYSKSVYSMLTSLTGQRQPNNNKFLFTNNTTSQSIYLLGLLTTSANAFSTEIPYFKNSDNGFVIPDLTQGDYFSVSGSDFYYRPGFQSTEELKKLIPVSPAEKIYAIKVNPKNLKNSIDEGNFELVLSKLNGNANPEVDTTSDYVLSLIDSSVIDGVILDGDTRDSYRFKSNFIPPVEYDLVSGSLDNGVYNESTPEIYGKVYPGYGLIILDANKLNTELSFGIVSQSNSDGKNPLRLFKSISGSAVTTGVRAIAHPFTMRNSEAALMQTITIDVNEREFNYSTNPSYYYSPARSPLFRNNNSTPFEGKITPYSLKYRSWFYEPVTYITSIGLYDENYQLVAIGKLSKPVKKTFSDSVKFVVNLKY